MASWSAAERETKLQLITVAFSLGLPHLGHSAGDKMFGRQALYH
jgi:hypothetical protein